MRSFIPGKKNHVAIFDYLYKDATIYLKRKRDKALNTVLNAVDKRTAQCNA
jgi:hypothetical protein